MPEVPEFRGNTHRKLRSLDPWVKQGQEEPLEPELPIIDAHHHVWDDERGRYLLPEFLEDISTGHNIVATVFVQARAMYLTHGAPEMQPVGEVEFASALAAASAAAPFGQVRVCAGIVGFADLMLGNDVRPVLDALIVAGNGYFRGIRHGATFDNGSAGYGRTFGQPHLMLDPAFRRGFVQLARMGLTFDAWLFHPQLPDLVDLLRDHPDNTVILDHLGGVLGIPPHTDRDEVFAVWSSHIRHLAAFPNLTVKLGGLGMLYGGRDFHMRDAPPSSAELCSAWRPYIETCIEAFGPSRCMFESNFPVDKQSCGYGVLWNAFKRITRNYSPSEKAALYQGTAAHVYQLSP